MDNKNNPYSDLAKAIKHIRSFANKMQSGEMLKDIPADQRAEVEKQIKENKMPEHLEDLEKKIKEFNNLSNTLNGTAH